MPSEDKTRNWYKLNTELDAEDIAALRKLELKHSIRQELANAIPGRESFACSAPPWPLPLRLTLTLAGQRQPPLRCQGCASLLSGRCSFGKQKPGIWDY